MINSSTMLLVLNLIILLYSKVHSSEVNMTPSTAYGITSSIKTRSLEKDSPKNIFISSFTEMAHSSQLFSTSSDSNPSPEEYSKAYYEIPYESADNNTKADQNPVSCRTILADSTYHTSGYMTLDEGLFSLTDFASTYLVSQKLLGFENAADLGRTLFKNYLESVPTDVSLSLAQIKANVFCHGIFKFVVSLHALNRSTVAAFCISLANNAFAVSGVWSEAKTELYHKNPTSKWDAFLASLPSPYDASGLNGFKNILLKSILNSVLLKNVLNLNLNMANAISDAWHHGILDEATLTGSLYPEALARYISQVMLRTSAMMSSNDYNKALGNGLGMYLLSQGLLNITTSEILANRMSNAMEKFANIPNGGSIVPYVSVIINGFREFHASDPNLKYDSDSIAAFVYYLSTEYFLVSGIKKPNIYI